jgi:hypothetical protein
LLKLPGEMIVCADGSGVNVRTAPSTEVEIVGTLPPPCSIRNLFAGDG